MFEDEVCPAIVDPNQLATALLNLALNARDAMPDGGKLIIETGLVVLDENYARITDDVRPGRYAMIAVSDTGTGIPAGILDKVFDPFFTSKGPGKGTGLGLSMVYGFIKQSAGHIKIYSEEGHGTTDQDVPAAGHRSFACGRDRACPELQGGHETILVVEDDKLVQRLRADAAAFARLCHAGCGERGAKRWRWSSPARHSTCCSPTSSCPAS